MSEHTKEPWQWSWADWRNEVHGYHAYIAGDFHEDGGHRTCTAVCRAEGNATSHDVTEANARRITACVNALAGIPTEYLETLQPGDLHAMYLALAEDAGRAEHAVRRSGAVVDLVDATEALFPSAQWDDNLARLKPMPLGQVECTLICTRAELEALRSAMQRARGEAPPA